MHDPDIHTLVTILREALRLGHVVATFCVAWRRPTGSGAAAFIEALAQALVASFGGQ